MEAKKIDKTSCYECEHHRLAFFNEYLIGCVLLKDWLTREEIKDGKKTISNCPIQEG